MRKLESSFYVYYRIAEENAAAARRAVMTLFAELRTGTGVSGRLVRRRDDPLMWMEIYERVPDDGKFESALISSAAQRDLERLVAAGSSRKTEIFVSDALDPESQIGGTACA